VKDLWARVAADEFAHTHARFTKIVVVLFPKESNTLSDDILLEAVHPQTSIRKRPIESEFFAMLLITCKASSSPVIETTPFVSSKGFVLKVRPRDVLLD
jgi:hypothetical protein